MQLCLYFVVASRISDTTIIALLYCILSENEKDKCMCRITVAKIMVTINVS